MPDITAISQSQWNLFKADNDSAGLKNKISALSRQQKTEKTQPEELKKVCADFESLFVSQMLKDMRNAVPKTDLFHGGHAEEIYTSLLDEKYAQEIALSGNLGLGKQLYETLSKNLASSKTTDTKESLEF